MNVIFLPSIFVRGAKLASIFLSRLRKPKLCFAIKEAQECVIKKYWCVWLEEELFDPICRLKTPQHIFQVARKVDIQSARQGEREREKKRQCGLCLGFVFSGEHSNQLLPSQTSFPILRDVIWLHRQSEMTHTGLHFFMFTNPQIRATHWISFLCHVSLSLCFVCFGFCPDNVSTRVSQSSSVTPTFTPKRRGWKRANEC